MNGVCVVAKIKNTCDVTCSQEWLRASRCHRNVGSSRARLVSDSQRAARPVDERLLTWPRQTSSQVSIFLRLLSNICCVSGKAHGSSSGHGLELPKIPLTCQGLKIRVLSAAAKQILRFPKCTISAALVLFLAHLSIRTKAPWDITTITFPHARSWATVLRLHAVGDLLVRSTWRPTTVKSAMLATRTSNELFS